MDSLPTLRLLNPLQEAMIFVLKEHGGLSRQELIRILKTEKHMDKARTTIYDNLLILIHEKIIIKYPKPRIKRGRPLIIFQLQT